MKNFLYTGTFSIPLSLPTRNFILKKRSQMSIYTLINFFCFNPISSSRYSQKIFFCAEFLFTFHLLQKKNPQEEEDEV